MLHRNAPLPQVAQAGEVTLATITTPELGELNVHAVAAELSRLVALHKRVRAAGGELVLANVTDPVYEVICLTRLHEVLDVRRPDAGSSTPLAS